jgi:pimeloyl-ACP methyl ester carboxylesterase
VPLAPGLAERAITARFEDELDDDEGWAKYNRHYWRRDYLGFLEFFFGEMFCEPHSTKQIEDCVAWAHEIAPSTLADTTAGRLWVDGAVCERIEPFCERVQCPVLVIHGTDDQFVPVTQTYENYKACASEKRIVIVPGADHGLSYLVDRKTYEKASLEFWQDYDKEIPAVEENA